MPKAKNVLTEAERDTLRGYAKLVGTSNAAKRFSMSRQAFVTAIAGTGSQRSLIFVVRQTMKELGLPCEGPFEAERKAEAPSL